MSSAQEGFTLAVAPLLDTFSSRVAIVDEASRLVAANQAWCGATAVHAGMPLDEALANYPDAAFVTSGVRDVLDGRRASFDLDYSPDGRRPHSRRLTANLLRQESRMYAVLVDDLRGDGEEHAALEFEKLLSEASAAFIRAPAHEIDAEICRWLERIGRAQRLDRATIGQVDLDEPGAVIATHQWNREGIAPIPHRLQTGQALPWLTARLLAGEVTVINSLRELPQAGATDLAFGAAIGANSTVWVPLRIGGQIAGGAAFGSVREERHWTAQTVRQLSRLTEVFGFALEREQSRAAIRKLREEAQALLRTAPLAEVTASLAHELNQPLGAILNNAQAARRLLNAKAAYRGEVKEAMEAIIRDVARATETIRHTRELFRAAGGEHDAVDIRQLIGDVANILRSDAKARGITLRLELAEDLPLAATSRQGLIQVLMNLLLNAFDAVAESRNEQRQVEVYARGKRGEIEVAVRDTGNGIAPEIGTRLFEAFVTSKPHGTGMGLAIARSIVEKSGGRIWHDADARPGATLRFALPALRPEPAKAAV